ncbi:uncharacterized protein B0H18DRAFT_1084613 [Fomitopsis serialis]|uniref:uncharacterized protein n=1 Tax=Fomitopsis serialis TaxID=139415 RepID=UPI002007302E|nr:uncharacterized protein B0H18DRAFT_1084613 [Neoantrodia serialis]KAH9928171.1 hypothetical protein B0H18DRAFT_1084613 [Neoantrodia serialis]
MSMLYVPYATEIPEETIDTKTAEHATTVTAVLRRNPEKWIHLSFTWSGNCSNWTSRNRTGVPALLQSLTDGKLPPDEETIANLKLTSGKKFSLVGTPQGKEIKDPSQLEFLPDVLNDLDIDFSANPAAASAYINDQRNQRKIRECTRSWREGKRLLVLDLDYTILDTKPLTSGALPPHECARPRLHEFLEAIYPHYDICIWSQTSWIWLETKLSELGMIGGGHSYEVCLGLVANDTLVLDKKCMFSVFQNMTGAPYGPYLFVFLTLQGRNFALNPSQGLKIAPFKDAHLPQARADRELDRLKRYMVHIATAHQDFREVDHKNWQYVVRGLPPA